MKQCFRKVWQRLLLLLLCCGFWGATACVKLSQPVTSRRSQNAPQAAGPVSSNTPLININTATPEQLEKLPGIGRGLAERIIEHREKYGRFRRIEHLIIVRGISARRFKEIRSLITVG